MVGVETIGVLDCSESDSTTAPAAAFILLTFCPPASIIQGEC